MTNIENKKSEALSRMITLGLHPKVMQKFQDGVLTCSELAEDGSFLHREPTAEELESIGAFQKEHNCLAWCNERASDGRWDLLTAMVCIDLIAEIRKIPFWKRERVWKNQHERQVLDEIIEPLNQKIIIDELEKKELQALLKQLYPRKRSILQ